MSNRNLTLTLPEDLVRRAKVAAAARDTSISALVAGYLEELTRESDYEVTWQRERELMTAGLPMRVGAVTWSRDNLHARE